MKNIHILPTEGESNLFYADKGKELCYTRRSTFYSTGIHVYITSDEEIKEDDWGLSRLNEVILFGRSYPKTLYKKIILTTDPTLIADGVQAIDDEFLEWFVKNPSCEGVEIKRIANGTANHKLTYEYKIIIPKEEPKQQRLNEKFTDTYSEEFLIDFTDWIADNLYQRYSYGWSALFDKGKYTTKELLEKFKKKREI
jgi:hypothetical protein